MTTPPDGSQPSLTAQDIDAWLRVTAEKYAAIHRKAAHPWPQLHRDEALVDMSALLLDALEEVRVISAQSREESQAARAKGQALRDHSTHLLKKSAACRERLAPFPTPPPEAIREAEGQLLERFKGEMGERSRKSNRPCARIGRFFGRYRSVGTWRGMVRGVSS